MDHGFDRFFGAACCPATDYLSAFIDGDRIPVPPTKMLDKSTLPKHPYAFDNRYDDNPGLKPFMLPDTAPGAPGQLYNLETDPGETRNVYFEQPQIVKELKTLLDQSKASGRSRAERSNSNP